MAQSWTSRAEADGNRDGKYVVVATVTDPSVPTWYDFIVVVITAEDINEDPVLSGRPELTINEIDSGDEDADSPLFVGNTADADPTVNVYNVVDEDRRAATKMSGAWRERTPVSSSLSVT